MVVFVSFSIKCQKNKQKKFPQVISDLRDVSLQYLKYFIL